MLMADNYLQLKEYKEAERHYIKASHTCPVKFMPLYELAKIYAEEGRNDKALVLANTILAKKVKVQSATLFTIKKEMRELINNIKDKHKTLKEKQDNVSSKESLETVLPP
jgi:tetratricopeptide (TPR) repeat protein